MDLDGPECLWACVGRRSDYAVQQRNGRYLRAFHPLTDTILHKHLAGQACVGTYVRDEQGYCSFAVFDADQAEGLTILKELQTDLANHGAPAYLERSRRGGHLWLFFREPCPAALARAWLLPMAVKRKLELFPKQSFGQGIGSLMRLPLGVHQRSGKRYPFLTPDLQPVARTLSEQLHWLAQVQRVMPPPTISLPPERDFPPFIPPTDEQYIDKSRSLHSIHDWNAAQNPFTLIGHYVRLGHNGTGHCPFSEHHDEGRDSHASFHVFYPRRPGGMCWYCYAWERGGTAFDFLRHYHRLDARTLWRQIVAGELP
ncbi:MAG TPA: hypothetical protein VF458_07365 [Ktedonobacteraceae bacterium]